MDLGTKSGNIWILAWIGSKFDMKLLTSLQIIVPTLLILGVPLLFASLSFKKAHRVKEYHCGEKDELSLSMYYFNIPDSYKKYIHYIALVSMIFLVLGVLL